MHGATFKIFHFRPVLQRAARFAANTSPTHQMKIDSLHPVRDHLATLKKARAAKAHHVALEPQWEAHEAELLAPLNLEDDAALTAVARIRLRRELLPRKIALLEQDCAACEQALLETLKPGVEVLHA